MEREQFLADADSATVFGEQEPKCRVGASRGAQKSGLPQDRADQ